MFSAWADLTPPPLPSSPTATPLSRPTHPCSRASVGSRINQTGRDEQGRQALPFPLQYPCRAVRAGGLTSKNKRTNQPRGGHLQQGVDEVDEVVLHEGKSVTRQALQDEARRLHHLMMMMRAAFALFAAAFWYTQNERNETR